ncbi:hypothetical protein OSSY52_08400 [Tepiditoga spiralis]|uniref:Uncharacterized protein n=1 Tax=Tepiditoga spiralis TaxID=2108365 RepID=A0A7G1GAW0_9BACT|nr:hypothetical protein [Tepiditoga spiralis]BBE30699.1 hypothetical protein OSSY52_08400 [Tepiditoga spiralis]
MSYFFKNLDEKTRKYMLEEVELDIKKNFLYKSLRFNEIGNELYPQILKNAIEFGNEKTLEKNLLPEYFEDDKGKILKIGKYTSVLSTISNRVFSEYEFNKFYIRAILRRAIEENKEAVIYQAKKSFYYEDKKTKTIVGFSIKDPKSVLKSMRLGFKLESSLNLSSNQRYYGLSVELK